MGDVIVTDDSAEAAADFAEGLAVGVALTEAETARADAAEAQATAAAAAELATAAVFDAEAKYAELQAALLGLHDQFTAGLAEVAEAVYLLAAEESELADEVATAAVAAEGAAVDAAIAEAEVTEIVESEPNRAETPPPDADAAPESGETGESGRNERPGSGRVRFRRGR